MILAQQPLPRDLPEDLSNPDTGDNFNDLISQTGGGRLILKSERDWNKDITLGGSDQFTHYFDLDVKQLAQAILTIPFHERFDLSDVPVTDQLKEKFTMEAKERLKEFETGETTKKDIKPPTKTIPENPVKEEPIPTITRSVVPIPTPVEVINDAVLNDPKEDIQGWLDDILDI